MTARARRALAAAAAVVAVVLAACTTGPEPGAPGQGGADTTAGEPGGTTTAGSDTAQDGSNDGTAEQPAPAPDGAVGAHAPFLLRPAGAGRLLVDVLAQQGAEPAPGVVDHLTAVLGDVSAKPVTTRGPAPLPGQGQAWSGDDLRAAARAAGAPGDEGTGVIHLLFVHGSSADRDSALGVAVSGSVAAVFVDRVEQAAGLVGDPGEVERAVATHELGHLLGLVDLVLDTGRGDPEHPHHSPNRGSVMYWAVETDAITQLLEGGPPTAFDGADRRDLARIRAGGG